MNTHLRQWPVDVKIVAGVAGGFVNELGTGHLTVGGSDVDSIPSVIAGSKPRQSLGVLSLTATQVAFRPAIHANTGQVAFSWIPASRAGMTVVVLARPSPHPSSRTSVARSGIASRNWRRRRAIPDLR